MAGDRLAKIPMFRNVAKAVTVNLDATNGATLGVNLFAADGKTLLTLASLGAPTTSPGVTGGSTAAPSVSGETTDDLQEGQFNLYFTNARAAAAAPIQSLAEGTNVTIDNTDPQNPVISASGGSGAFPIVTGDVPPVLLYLDDGSLVYDEVH